MLYWRKACASIRQGCQGSDRRGNVLTTLDTYARRCGGTCSSTSHHVTSFVIPAFLRFLLLLRSLFSTSSYFAVFRWNLNTFSKSSSRVSCRHSHTVHSSPFIQNMCVYCYLVLTNFQTSCVKLVFLCTAKFWGCGTSFHLSEADSFVILSPSATNWLRHKTHRKLPRICIIL